MEEKDILCFQEDFQKVPIFADIDRKYIYPNDLTNVPEPKLTDGFKASHLINAAEPSSSDPSGQAILFFPKKK